MGIYNQYRLIDVVNNFISNYHTKGNMKLLTESFQRKLIISDFKRWFTYSINGFTPISISQPLPQIDNNIISDNSNEIIEEQIVVQEEKIVVEEEQVVEEQEQVVEEEQIMVEEEQEQITVEEEQVVVEEQEQIVEDIGINMEQIYEEPVIEEVVKPKRKKNKNKK